MLPDLKQSLGMPTSPPDAEAALEEACDSDSAGASAALPSLAEASLAADSAGVLLPPHAAARSDRKQRWSAGAMCFVSMSRVLAEKALRRNSLEKDRRDRNGLGTFPLTLEVAT